MAFEELGIRFSTTGVNSTLADVKRVDGEINRMVGSATKNTNIIRGLSNKLSGWGRSLAGFGMALAPLGAVIGGIGFAGLRTASQFEDAMAEISARTGIVGDDLKRIEDFALQMGAQTVYSANEAAAGFLQLLASGQTAEQALSTLPIVLDLAAASGEDLGFTADALTDIMAAFNLGVGDSIYVADALARAAGASSADVASLAAGFGNVGPVARQFGIDVDTTAAILAVLSENGIKAAEGGTALRSMLLNMTRPTEAVQDAWKELGTSFYNADGSARPITDVLADIKIGLKDLPLEDQNRLLKDLAGNYGIVALQALLGEMSIEDMEAAMEGQASAAEVAAKRMNTFSGRVEGLKGSIETLMIKAMRPFMDDVLKPIVTYATEVVNKLAEWAEKNPELTSTILTLGAALVALVAVSLTLGGILSGLGALIGLLASPVLLALAAFAGLGAYLGLFGDDIKNKTREWVDKFVEWVPGAVESLRTELGKIIDTVTAWITEQAPKIKARLLTWADTFLGWVVIAIPLVRGQLNSLINTITTWITEQAPKIKTRLLIWADTFLGWVVTAVTAIPGQLSTLIDTVTGWISEQSPKIKTQLVEWANQFIDWASGLWPQIQTDVDKVADEIKHTIEIEVPNIKNKLKKWADQFVDWASNLWDMVRYELDNFVSEVKHTIELEVPNIRTKLKAWKEQFTVWATDAWIDLKPELDNLFTQMKTWITEQVPVLALAVLEWAQLFWNWVKVAGFLLVIELFGFLTTFGNWITNTLLPYLKDEAAPEIAAAFLSWITGAKDDLPVEMDTLAKKTEDELERLKERLADAAIKLGKSLVSYIVSGGMGGFGEAIIDELVRQVKAKLGIESFGLEFGGEYGEAQPSKYGEYETQGPGYAIGEQVRQWGGRYGLSPFMAGEKGPEMVFPRSGGFVASNHLLRNLANTMMNPVLSGNTTNRNLNYAFTYNVQSDESAYYHGDNMMNLLIMANQF